MVAVSKEPKSRVGLQSGGITVERFRSRDSVVYAGFLRTLVAAAQVILIGQGATGD